MTLRRLALLALAATVGFVTPREAAAQPGREAAAGPAPEAAPQPGRETAAEPGSNLAVHVLTFGPGDHPFFKFGHNAILIQPTGGRGIVYNFGTFDFDSLALIPKFLRGRLTYWLSVAGADETLYSYEDANRTIEAQELDLTPAERWTLYQRLRENALPKNREYLYDYFWDNCSTRVRDAVDGIVGGRVKAAGQGAAGMTFRNHALRLVADDLPVYLGLHVGLGSLTDAPIDLWREAFLPERLRDLLRVVRLPREGGERPLVKAERVLFTAKRAPMRTRPPAWELAFGATGVAIGGALALLGVYGRRRRATRIALGATSALVGFVAGLLGMILVALWLFTNHRAAHANANILQCAPFAIALVPFGIGLARGKRGASRRALTVAAAAAVLAVLGVAAKLLPGDAQDNAAFIALFLPIWVGMTIGVARLLPATPALPPTLTPPSLRAPAPSA